jgi:NTE family protein
MYPAHLGAAQRLYDIGFAPTSIIGTSGGAIVGAFLSTGAKPKDGLELARKILPKDILSFNWGFWQKNNWGLLDFSKFEKLAAPYFPQTFANSKIPLTVVTSEVNSQKAALFSSTATPKMTVPRAVRASATVPFLFAPVRCRDWLLVDGGVVNGYAIDLAEGPTVGIRVLSEGEPPVLLKGNEAAGSNVTAPRNILDFTLSVLGCMMRELERKHIEDALYAKTITVKVPWNPMDFFRMDAKVVEQLYNIGYNSVSKRIDAGWKWDIPL